VLRALIMIVGTSTTVLTVFSITVFTVLFYYNICVCHLCSNKRELKVHTGLKYGHVDYMICLLNFISVKNSKYQL